MTKNKSIGVIGCGNMGSALVENLKKRLPASAVFVCDKDKGKQGSLVKSFQAQACDDVKTLVSKSGIIIIAAKPQDIDEVLTQLRGVCRGKLLVSIAAGITISYLESVLGEGVVIVRAMPNLNALIGKSLTALSFSELVTEEDKIDIREVFEAVGEVIFLQESQMNAATAISGSGLAFVALLKDDLKKEDFKSVFIQEAVNEKIDKVTAQAMASATINGTLEMIKVRHMNTDTLIMRVCSKGGTTEAGMEVLQKVKEGEKKEKEGLKKALSEAIRAACKRAQELSRRA